MALRFKVGDKVRTVKEFADGGGGDRLLPIGTICTIAGFNPHGRSPYLVRANNEVRYWYQEDMLEPYEEKTYEQGLADAWELAKKPIIKPWNPAKCPSCGASLSESLGDGYYRHHVLKARCDCGQFLDWSEGKE